MIEHAFTKKNLAKCIAYKDIINDKKYLDIENRQLAAGSALKKIKNQNIFKQPLKGVNIAGKKAYQFDDIESELVARLISQNLRSNYKIKQQNRQIIVKNLVTFLKEGCPYTVYRFDIKNFFEEVNRSQIIKSLLGEGRVSRQTILLLNELFDALSLQKINGLPRGIGISSILSEYVLLNFDKSIEKENEVFFYSRFVDDILIISSSLITNEYVSNLLKENLPSPLELHKSGDKFSSVSVKKMSTSPGGEDDFEYLGYKFSIFEEPNSNDEILGIEKRKIGVEISDGKVKKIKNRLIDSFSNYLSKSPTPEEFHLLKNRIKALTGNYYISDPISGVKIKTGIFFNYSEKNQFLKCSLYDLDSFLRGLIYSKKHDLSKRISGRLSKEKQRELIGYTFHSGFHKPRFHSFEYATLNKIKECWKK